MKHPFRANRGTRSGHPQCRLLAQLDGLGGPLHSWRVEFFRIQAFVVSPP